MGYLATLVLLGLLILIHEAGHLAAARRESARVAGLVLIAPAWDMTRALMWDRWSKKARKEFEATGLHFARSEYSAEPDPISRALIEDGDAIVVDTNQDTFDCTELNDTATASARRIPVPRLSRDDFCLSPPVHAAARCATASPANARSG